MATDDIGISSIVSRFPQRFMSVQELADGALITSKEERLYRETLGLPGVYVWGDESPEEALVSAGEGLLAESEIEPASVDAIVLYHTLYLTSLEPRSLVSEVRTRLGCHRAFGYAVSGVNCASVVPALRLARNMVKAGSARRVLLVSFDSFAGSLRRALPEMTLQGEAVTAALVEGGCGRNRLIGIRAITNPAFYQNASCSAAELTQFDRAYFLTLQRIVRQLLNELNLSVDHVGLIVPHNVNRASWELILRQLKVPESRFFADNIGRHGHVCSSDLMVNLRDAIEQRRIRPGEYIMMLTVGLGASWGCVVLQH